MTQKMQASVYFFLELTGLLTVFLNLLLFHDSPRPTLQFQDFPDLEINEIKKFHGFPGFP